MKVLICGGPKSGETLHIQPNHSEIRFAVLDPKFFPLRSSDTLSTKPSFETVENKIYLPTIRLPNGKECTFALAVTEKAMNNMSIPNWLELLSVACQKGCTF